MSILRKAWVEDTKYHRIPNIKNLSPEDEILWNEWYQNSVRVTRREESYQVKPGENDPITIGFLISFMLPQKTTITVVGDPAEIIVNARVGKVIATRKGKNSKYAE